MKSPFDEEDCLRRYGEQLDAYEEAARKEIHALFKRGFAGEHVLLPDAYIGQGGEWKRADIVAFEAAVSEAMHGSPAQEWLLQSCKAHMDNSNFSETALGQFMVACANEYCAEHASDIAKAAMDGELGEAWENRL